MQRREPGDEFCYTLRFVARPVDYHPEPRFEIERNVTIFRGTTPAIVRGTTIDESFCGGSGGKLLSLRCTGADLPYNCDEWRIPVSGGLAVLQEGFAVWELFGIDLALTADWEMVCYEINSGPCIKNENKEMLHSLVDITLPFGYELSRPDPKLRWNVLVDTHPAELRAAAGCPTAKEGGAKPAAGDAATVQEKWREPVENLMARFGCGSAAAVEALTKSDGHAGKAAAALRLSFQEIPRVGTERPKSAGAEAAARSAAEQQAEKNEETAEDNVGAEAQAAREDKADAQQGVEEQAAANAALAEARQDASDAQTESGEETEVPAPAPAPPVTSAAER